MKKMFFKYSEILNEKPFYTYCEKNSEILKEKKNSIFFFYFLKFLEKKKLLKCYLILKYEIISHHRVHTPLK